MKKTSGIAFAAALLMLAVCLLTACGRGDPEHVEISRRVTKIEDKAYYNNTTIRTVVIPDTVTEIGRWAFSGCENLESVVIPDSVTKIGKYAFQGCNSLRSVTIPGSVTSFGGYEFSLCTGLTEVTLGEGLEEIGSYLFENCTALTKISFPASLRTIGGFSGCTALNRVEIPDGVAWIQSYAFQDCTGLAEVVIPPSVIIIGQEAFAGCTGLTGLDIPGTVSRIDREAFRDCTALRSLTIQTPEKDLQLYDAAFAGCTSLAELTIPGTTRDSDHVPQEFTPPFSGCDALADVLVTGPELSRSFCRLIQDCAGIRTVSFSEALTQIGDGAFDGTILQEGLEELLPASTEGGDDLRGQAAPLPELDGASVIPVDEYGSLIGSLYALLPGDVRSVDGRSADYALMIVRGYQHSDREYTVVGYGTVGASDAWGEAWLCGRDGTRRLLARKVNTPGLTEDVTVTTMNGMSVAHSVFADPVEPEELWESIRVFFGA